MVTETIIMIIINVATIFQQKWLGQWFREDQLIEQKGFYVRTKRVLWDLGSKPNLIKPFLFLRALAWAWLYGICVVWQIAKIVTELTDFTALFIELNK